MRTETRDILELALTMLSRAERGHVGSTITAALILGEYVTPHWKDDHQLVLSKAHACAAEYAFHAIVSKRATREQVLRYPYAPWYGHSDSSNGVSPFTLGSLGMGLSMAMGLSLTGPRVWCIVGDGELESGNMQEALGHLNENPYVYNVTVIIDRNGASACRTVDAPHDVWPKSFKFPKNIGLRGTGLVASHYCRISEAQIPAIIAEVDNDLSF